MLGTRRLAEVSTSLAGEVGGPSLYARALSADEVAASFQAGALSVDAETLTNSLTSAEREKRATLLQELDRLRTELSRRRDPTNQSEAWNRALADAAKDNGHPLHPWSKLSGLSGSGFREGWIELATYWKTELASRREFNRTNFTHGWNLRADEARQWFMAGTGAGAPVPPGEFSIEPPGHRGLPGWCPSGVYLPLLPGHPNHLLTSPPFPRPVVCEGGFVVEKEPAVRGWA